MTRTWVEEAEAALEAAAADLSGRERLGWESDVPLHARTYIGVGGPARVFLAPRDAEALAAALGRLHAAGARFDYLGAGSNLLVADEGPSFVVVSSERLAGEPILAEASARAGAGLGLPRLAQRLQKSGLSGLEFAEGIPGSVGGALKMNAGWHEKAFGDLVTSFTAVTRDGRIETLRPGPGMFEYRTAPGLGTRCVVEATLRLQPEDPARIAETMRSFRDHRVRTQPTGERNAGCMFRNPAGDHAGRLIDACGLKGTAVGRAQVSEVHANFFINRGGATCRDVRALLDQVRETVRRQAGVALEPEVVLWT